MGVAKRQKYNNRKTVVDNITFDSMREAERYSELKLLARAGEITQLRRQVPYTLIPKQDGERACVYIADFVYRDRTGREVVEDVKGVKTDVYKLKRKLMKWVHGITVKEV